jgi:hypothetical protein
LHVHVQNGLFRYGDGHVKWVVENVVATLATRRYASAEPVRAALRWDAWRSLTLAMLT